MNNWNSPYHKAKARSDLSEYLIHLTKGDNAFFTLVNILQERQIRPSQVEHVTRFWPQGAACFYDVPPWYWPELVNTNPSNRLAFGVIVEKTSFWRAGGRPAIYTEHSEPSLWPENERYRLCHADLTRTSGVIDWMHEREWRFRGRFPLDASENQSVSWWPMVPNFDWLPKLTECTKHVWNTYVLSASNFYWSVTTPGPAAGYVIR